MSFLWTRRRYTTIFATNRETKIHAQLWRIIYDDGDTEDMDRLQVKATLGLAKKIKRSGKGYLRLEYEGLSR